MSSLDRNNARNAGRCSVGILGFSTGSPSIDRHLWAAKCGYVPGISIAHESLGLVYMLDWLARTDVVLADVTAWESVDASVDAVRLQPLVGSVWSGACTKETLVLRYPVFGAILFQIILMDRLASGRALFWSGRTSNDAIEVSSDSDEAPPGGA